VLRFGGFYKHFGSRDELVVEALAAAFKDLDVWEEHTADMAHFLQNYLTEAHRDAPGTGCAMGALVGDMTRGSKSARALYTARVKRSLAFFSALLPFNRRSDKRRRALLILSALLGAINLSRAVSDPNLSREILHGVREGADWLGETGISYGLGFHVANTKASPNPVDPLSDPQGTPCDGLWKSPRICAVLDSQCPQAFKP
jgi:TetR/AcrR family transcriptional regulator, transcriptional repressor for nem operon